MNALALFKRHYKDFVQNTERSPQEASIYAACILCEYMANEMAEPLDVKYVAERDNGK